MSEPAPGFQKHPDHRVDIRQPDQLLENAVWGYADPYLECEPLRGHLAFYTDRVDLEVNGVAVPRQGPGWTA